METIPSAAFYKILEQLPLNDLLNLSDTCCYLKGVLQRLVWSRVHEIYWDRFGTMLFQFYPAYWRQFGKELPLVHWRQSGTPHSLIYWGGELHLKRCWFDLDYYVVINCRTWLQPCHLGLTGTVPPPLPSDKPHVLLKLVRRCGANVKTLIFETNSSRDYPSVYDEMRGRGKSQVEIQCEKRRENADALRLLHAALQHLPCLESLATNCRMSGRGLVELIQGMPAAARMTQLTLLCCVCPPSWERKVGQETVVPLPRARGPRPFHEAHVSITPADFHQLLAVMPSLERLSSYGSGVVAHLSFSAGSNLRSIELRCSRSTFISGSQLRELASCCPLLEELHDLVLLPTPPKGIRGDDWNESKSVEWLLKQSDIDYFCSNAKRLKYLAVSYACNLPMHQAPLSLSAITSLERLAIDFIRNRRDNDDVLAPLKRHGLPIEGIEDFPSLRALSMPYVFRDDADVRFLFKNSLPPYFTRLCVSGNAEGAEFSDSALLGMISAMGASGRRQLEALRLENAPLITADAIGKIVLEYTALNVVELIYTRPDPTQLIDALGAALDARQDMSRVRLVQHATEFIGRNRLAIRSMNMHPRLDIEWMSCVFGNQIALYTT